MDRTADGSYSEYVDKTKRQSDSELNPHTDIHPGCYNNSLSMQHAEGYGRLAVSQRWLEPDPYDRTGHKVGWPNKSHQGIPIVLSGIYTYIKRRPN